MSQSCWELWETVGHASEMTIYAPTAIHYCSSRKLPGISALWEGPRTLVERALGQHPHLLAERGHHYVWKWCGKAHARSGGHPQHLLCWGSASRLDSWKGGCGHSGCSVSPCGMVLNSCCCTRGPGRERASALASEGAPPPPAPHPKVAPKQLKITSLTLSGQPWGAFPSNPTVL